MSIKIVKECSDYLKESGGQPLVRQLPIDGPDLRKIKVRKKKSESTFDRLFNMVFIEHPDLRQRCIFAHGERREIDLEPDMDKFYVFPPDGYRFIYSPGVMESSVQYHDTLQKFIDIMEEDQAIETFSEVLKYDYTSSNLAEGIKNGSEIILYGIPHYYALRVSSVKSYSTLFSL